MPSSARLEAGIDSEIFNFSHVVACCAMASEMPTFVTVSIYDSSCSRMFLEWTISDKDDECEGYQDKRKIEKELAICTFFLLF